ncbi:CopG family antitoxin [Marinobacter subterrani]|uniref:CopG family antitoxin n=1 Tax=Marinobacter subterrani TaxID=1658765 RepID=UPI003B5AEDB5
MEKLPSCVFRESLRRSSWALSCWTWAFRVTRSSTKTISLRLPETLLDRIKIEANKRDIPYQSLVKAWLADDVNDSRRT